MDKWTDSKAAMFDVHERRRKMFGSRSKTTSDLRSCSGQNKDKENVGEGTDSSSSIQNRKLPNSLRRMTADSGLRSRGDFEPTRGRRLRMLKRRLTDDSLQDEPETELEDEEVKEVKNMAPVALWRRRTKLVCMMCRVCMALQKYAHTAGYVDLDKYERGMSRRTRTSDEEEGGERRREEASFNKNDYKTVYEFTWPHGALRIIRKLPDERTEEDCAAIRAIMRNLQSFRKYTDEMQCLLSKVVRYCRYGPKRVIVRKGHVGQSLYFVFSGAVSVVFDKEETSMFARPVEISVLKKGEVFGEIALLKNTTRNATIVCSTDTELLAVDRDEFHKYGLYDLFLKECQYRIDFLGNLDLFSTWPTSSIEELCYVSRIEPYSYNRVIIKDATKSEWIYFISSGCCDLLRLVDLAKSQDFQQILPPTKRHQLHKSTVFLDMETSANYMRSLTETNERPQTSRAGPSRPQTSRAGPSRPQTSRAGPSRPQTSRAGLSRPQTSRAGPSRPQTSHKGPSSPTHIKTTSAGPNPPTRHQTSGTGPSLPIIAVNGEEVELAEGSFLSADPGSRLEETADDKLRRASSILEMGGAVATPGEKLRRAAWAVKAASTITDRKKILCRGTEPDTEYGRVGVGMFVKVGLLRPGQAFGLSNFYEPPRFFSLVSKGAEVIRVPRSKFRDLADDVTMEKIRHLVRSYPGDENICRDFMRENTWNLFKQDLVDVVVTESPCRRVGKKSGPEARPAHAQSGRRELLRRCQTATGYERPALPRMYSPSSQSQSSPQQRRGSYHGYSLASKLRQHTGMTSQRPKTAVVARQPPNSAAGRRTTVGRGQLGRPKTCTV